MSVKAKAKVSESKILKVAREFGNTASADVAEYGAKETRYLYEHAAYDGSVSDIDIRVEQNKNGASIIVTGPQVLAIEFGADGSDGTKVLYNKKTGQAFWFYKLGENPKFDAGGGRKKVPAKKYLRNPDDPKGGYFKNKKEAMAAWEKDWQEMGFGDMYPKEQYMRDMEREARVYVKEFVKRDDGKMSTRYTRSRKGIRRKDDPENNLQSGLIESNKFGWTRGNKPQNILQKALIKMEEYVRGW